MRYFLNFILLLGFFSGKAQTGHYFLSHCFPEDKHIDPTSFDMAQDAFGVMHFATRSGVLTYDGKNWELISCGGPVYAIEADLTGRIFWAGADGVGLIKKDKTGKPISMRLSSPDKKNVYQALALNDIIYFLNDDGVFLFHNDSLRELTSNRPLDSFISLFEIFGSAYVSTERGKIFKVDDVSFTETTFDLKEGITINFSCRAKEKFLLGTSDNKLLLCSDDFSIEHFETKENEYLNASVIVNGVSLNNEAVALGTLRGGVIILNLREASVEAIVNYATGLPDNEVFALFVDQDKNIWVSHDYGFTRISPFAPFRSFNYFDDLKGNLLCAISVHNEVYVGTSLGLFKLSREAVYDEIVFYEDVLVRQGIAPEKVNKEETTKTSEPESRAKKKPEKNKKGFLRFLKRNQTRTEEVQRGSKDNVSESYLKKNNPQPAHHLQRTKSIQKVLRSENFVYKQVQGIDAKVTHLTISNGTLVAAGLGGLYEVNDISAKPIIEEPVRSLSTSGDSVLLVSTYQDKISIFVKESFRWKMLREIDGPEDQITYIFNGLSGDMWLCGDDHIYRLESNTFTIFNLENHASSRIIGIPWSNKVVFATANGFYEFNSDEKRVIKIDSMSPPTAYFATNTSLWYHDGHRWSTFGQTETNKNIQLLNLCGEIRFISPDPNTQNLWVINSSNELYKFLPGAKGIPFNNFPLLLRNVVQNGKQLIIGKKVVIQQEDGPVEIALAQVNFAEGQSVEYRYRIKGLSEEWSEWSTLNDRIKLNYLPARNYDLMVQSRSALGTINEIDTINIHVRPPYWKTPWFYAMEFTIFALLVLLSFKLSVRYRFISRVLSLLTIILLIELIQTIIGFSFATNSSPVIDFIIQAIVALIILPVEGFLRNLMFKSMGSNSRLLDVIAEMDKNEKVKK